MVRRNKIQIEIISADRILTATFLTAISSVPHGNVLVPLIYLIYTNDIPEIEPQTIQNNYLQW